MSRTELKLQLVRHEGLRLKPYRCTAGKLTIGVGRNLDDVGITADEARALLENDIAKVEREVRAEIPWFDQLDDARQNVLLNMAFNLGTNGLLKFPFTLSLVERGEYAAAAKAMLESKWARQVGKRATELSQIMATAPVPVAQPTP